VNGGRDGRLLAVDAAGSLRTTTRAALASRLTAGDLLVANDAATIPASLAGVHERSGGAIEVRLAGRSSLAVDDVRQVTALVFGAGDHRTPTERRPAPPLLEPDDVLRLGPLGATVVRTLDHPRLVVLRFAGTPAAIWRGIARHGRPIQYAHAPEPYALWDVWTRIAAVPGAFEPPSAGFALDWELLRALATRGVGLATLTHAAGISSTGDPDLDARLPLDEPYHLPAITVAAIARARTRGGRVVAVGTTVTRALEHAARRPGGLHAGDGVATQRIGARTELRVVDALLTGVHEPGTSHHELLRAFLDDHLLARVDERLARDGYRRHEHGDSLLVERQLASRSPASAGRLDHQVVLEGAAPRLTARETA
jgi:S-adenosylmethionine:tRNA ribosyltransferase-isomerase